MISTFCPASMPPDRRPWSAVVADTGTAAARSKEVRGLGLQLVLPSRGVLHEGASADPEDLVAHDEPRDRRADGDHRSGHGEPGTGSSGPGTRSP